MLRLAFVFGIAALVFALADVVHGQHNGDAHRFYIHAPEFIFFLGLLAILAIQAFKVMTGKIGLDYWEAAVFISIFLASRDSCFSVWQVEAPMGTAVHSLVDSVCSGWQAP